MGTKEEDVGIRCWATSTPGFTGILKQRYSDFKVNEIDTDGQVVQLTRLETSTAVTQQQNVPTAASTDVTAGQPPVGDPASACAAGSDASGSASTPGSLEADGAAPQAATAENGQPAASTSTATAVAAAASAPEVDNLMPESVVEGFETAAAAERLSNEQHVTEGSLGEEGAATSQQKAAEDVEAAMTDFEKLTGTEAALKLREFVLSVKQQQAAAADAKPPEPGARRQKKPPPPSFLLPPVEDKMLRKAIHDFFKSEPRLPAVATETVQPTDHLRTREKTAGVIQVTLLRQKQGGSDGRGAANGRSDGGGGKRKREEQGWDDDGRHPGYQFLWFAMFKENMDTQAALGVLGRRLNCRPSVFAVAGTKDKRACTVQAVTAQRMSDARLAKLNSSLRGMRVGSFKYVDKPLGLGASLGNQFEIVLRGIEGATPQQVAAAAQALAEHGFINYFGLQRFGSGGMPTHRVGVALLRGQWAEAVRMIMATMPGEKEDIAHARQLYLQKGDVAGALRALPHFMTAERCLLEGLRRNGTANWVNALSNLPRNMRSMYVHAYQSYLWNTAASHRIKRYGADKVVEGDLVLRSEEGVEYEGGERSTDRYAAAHVVTAAEAEAGDFDITDVVLPLPGSRVRMPEHETAQVYTETAAADGVALDSCPHAVRDWSMTQLPGDYRRLLHRPTDLRWALLRYSRPDQALALTQAQELDGTADLDLNVLEGSTLEVKAKSAAPATPCGEAGGGEKLLALQLRFRLPPSCYATMLIRELLKSGTSTALHKSLTQAAAVNAADAAVIGAETAAVVAAAAQTSEPLTESIA